MNSDFVQHDIDGKRTGFTVTPGLVTSSKLDMGLALGFVLIVLVVFRVNDSWFLSFIRFALMVGGGWWIFKNANRWTAKPTDHMPGGQFVVSFQGIELADGRFINRDEIRKLSVANYDAGKKFWSVAHLLQVDADDGHPRWVVGGMDRQTADRLLAAVKLAMGFVVVNASSTVAASAGMQPGDLLLTEVTDGVYELQRKTAGGHEVAAKPPHDLVPALEFAQREAGDTPLWFTKLADRGGAPIRVPKA